MATESQLIKLEKINKIYDKTPEKKLPQVLSRGHIGYEKALKSIMRAGNWAIATSILSTGIIGTITAIKWINPYALGFLGKYDFSIAIILIVCSVISGVLGYKISKLDATPQYVLVALLIILIVNSCLFAGIFPIITAIMCIIALVRYSTFCSWFKGVK